MSADVVRIFLVQSIKLFLPLPARRGAVVLAGTYKIVYDEQASFTGRAKTLPDATLPMGKIHPFTKIAVTFELIVQF